MDMYAWEVFNVQRESILRKVLLLFNIALSIVLPKIITECIANASKIKHTEVGY